MTPIITLLALPTYYLARAYRSNEELRPSTKVNLNVNKQSSKIVDTADIEDIQKCDGKKAVYCRCWRSKKFPMCDGSHNQHNEVTGDNVGPLIVKA